MRLRTCPLHLLIVGAFALCSLESDATLTPVGDEVEVATATEREVHSPRVAIDANGGFHVVWQSFTLDNDSEWDIHSRSFDDEGEALVDEQVVNTYTLGFQESPTVAVADGGEFVVSWSGAGEDDESGVSARVFDGQATPKTDETRLHEATSDVFERAPSAANDEDGFLVAWIEDARVTGMRLDADGTARGSFENAVDEPERVAIDSLPAGEFVVAWSSSAYSSPEIGAYGYTGIVEGRFFDADDVAGDGFQVNATRDDPTGYGFVVDGNNTLAISAAASGDFVAGFDSYVPDYVFNVDEQVEGFDIGMQTERFSGGASQGTRFVSENATAPRWSDVAMTPAGNVVTVEDGNGILVHALDCNGDDVSGGPVSVDADGTLGPERPSVAANEDGDVVVVWQQAREAGNGSTVAAQRFRLTDGCALCGDADANGRITAVDALAALRASVGLGSCGGDRCDTGGPPGITATDALRILDEAVASEPSGLVCSAG